jgi:hypothetical protein
MAWTAALLPDAPTDMSTGAALRSFRPLPDSAKNARLKIGDRNRGAEG